MMIMPTEAMLASSIPMCVSTTASNEEFFDWEPEKYAANYRQSARRHRGTDEMEWDGLLLLGWRPL